MDLMYPVQTSLQQRKTWWVSSKEKDLGRGRNPLGERIGQAYHDVHPQGCWSLWVEVSHAEYRWERVRQTRVGHRKRSRSNGIHG